MPIYEYACESCGHTFERRQGFNDEPVSECPECRTQVRRVLYPAGIIFKGSGFYLTDNRKSNGGAESNSESRADSKTTEKTKDAAPAAAND
jgi:putative FmdB family regulatory protein